MYDLKYTIGLAILAIRGVNGADHARYILFDDKETYIELEEQDYYTHHDCSFQARHIEVWQNKERWQNIFSNKKVYPEITQIW